MLKLRCVVEHITYQNSENEFSIMKVNVKGYNASVTLVGNLLDVPVSCYVMETGKSIRNMAASLW